jgi:hypothetical protein
MSSAEWPAGAGEVGLGAVVVGGAVGLEAVWPGLARLVEGTGRVGTGSRGIVGGVGETTVILGNLSETDV